MELISTCSWGQLLRWQSTQSRVNYCFRSVRFMPKTGLYNKVMREKFWLESCSAFVVACFLLFKRFVIISLCPIVLCCVVLILLHFQFVLILHICSSSRLFPGMLISSKIMLISSKINIIAKQKNWGDPAMLLKAESVPSPVVTVFFVKNLRLETYAKLSNLHPSV